MRAGLIQKLAGCILVFICTQGCLSSLCVSHYIGKDSYPDLELKTERNVHVGAYLGMTTKAGRDALTRQKIENVSFHVYEFYDVLWGDNARVLQLYIPKHVGNVFDGIMNEVQDPSTNVVGKVVLVVGNPSDVLGQSQLPDILETSYNIPKDEWSNRPVLLVRRPGLWLDSMTGIVCYDAAGSHLQFLSNGNLRRVRRSYYRWYFGPALYLVSLPFDIITFPIQAVLWISQGGPG